MALLTLLGLPPRQVMLDANGALGVVALDLGPELAAKLGGVRYLPLVKREVDGVDVRGSAATLCC